MNQGEVTRSVEALLFLSPAPLSIVELCEITEEAPGPVQRALVDLQERHGPHGGLEVVEVAGGFALRTRADLAHVCDRLREHPPDDRLSAAALETLAVIAYMAPIGRPEIGRLRGVSVDSTVANLVDRGLLEEAGRDQSANAMRYRTTRAFQKRFGLADRRDLPPIERFELSGGQAEDLRRTLIDSGHLAPDTVRMSEAEAPVDGDAEASEVEEQVEGGSAAPNLTVVTEAEESEDSDDDASDGAEAIADAGDDDGGPDVAEDERNDDVADRPDDDGAELGAVTAMDTSRADDAADRDGPDGPDPEAGGDE